MGSAAALDIIGRHGCALASTNASHLRTYARRRGSDAWDKAYAAGYSKIVATKCGRGFSGGRRRQKGR